MLAVDSIINPVEGAEPPPQLEDLEIEASEKIKNCIWASNKLQGEILAAKTALETAQAYIASRKKAVEKIEQDIRLTMEVMLLDKIDDPDCKVSLGVASKVVEIVDEEKISTMYKTEVPATWKVDKTALKKALLDGREMSGAKIVDGKRRLNYAKPKA